MDIVVNDTNIFLDLISIGLLDASFELPIKFHTVDYVIEEIINEEQNAEVAALIKEGKLYVKYLQLIIPQYFISNKSGIWSLSLIVHSKG